MSQRFTTRPEIRGTFGAVASTHWIGSVARWVMGIETHGLLDVTQAFVWSVRFDQSVCEPGQGGGIVAVQGNGLFRFDHCLIGEPLGREHARLHGMGERGR